MSKSSQRIVFAGMVTGGLLCGVFALLFYFSSRYVLVPLNLETEPVRGRSASSLAEPVALLDLPSIPAPKERVELSPEHPNVLFILVDTLRADALNLYGARNTTPVIRELGDRGTVFEWAYSQAPFTVASMASLFAGAYPSALRIAENTYHISGDYDLLAEKLARRGYRTGAVVANCSLTVKMGIYQGIGSAMEICEGERLVNTSGTVTRLAAEFMEKPSQAPFFLWVHYYDPHAAYDPPDDFRSLKNYYGPLPRRVEEMRPPGLFFPPDDLSYIQSLYLDDVRFVDHNIGVLLDILKRRGVYEKTLVVLASDHGEEHYDHGSMWHGHSLYEELLHVPLVLRGPGVPEGLRVAAPVEIMGLFPSLEEILNLPSHSGAKRRQGASFAPLLRNPPGAYAKPYVFAEHIFYGEPRRALRMGKLKLIEHLVYPRLELYELDVDPMETRNLSWDSPGTVQEFMKTMNRISEESKSLVAPMASGEKSKHEKETQERLRSLGYLQ